MANIEHTQTEIPDAAKRGSLKELALFFLRLGITAFGGAAAGILVGIIAWAYVRYGHLPAVAAVLYGVKPVVIAVILQALWGLGRTAVKSWLLAIAGVFCVWLSAAQVNVLIILFGTGAVLACIHAAATHQKGKKNIAAGLALMPAWRGWRAGVARIFPWAGATGA